MSEFPHQQKLDLEPEADAKMTTMYTLVSEWNRIAKASGDTDMSALTKAGLGFATYMEVIRGECSVADAVTRFEQLTGVSFDTLQNPPSQ